MRVSWKKRIFRTDLDLISRVRRIHWAAGYCPWGPMRHLLEAHEHVGPGHIEFRTLKSKQMARPREQEAACLESSEVQL